MMSLQLFKKGSPPAHIVIEDAKRLLEDLAFGRVRCPLCGWQPSATSLWACQSLGTPEPFFGGCGAMWNTFDTRGRCPGCSHQWQWTSCHLCHGWSLHDDWYEQDDDDRP
jgi:hypothetical protein